MKKAGNIIIVFGKSFQSLTIEAANSGALSPEEIKANQLQVDSILQTIDRIANSTSYQNTKLLNGNFDYTTSNVSADISKLKVNSARLSNTAGAYGLEPPRTRSMRSGNVRSRQGG